MCKRFEEWRSDIQKYCAENGLSFSKAEKMVKGSNENMLVLQYHDPNIKTNGLLDETPMPAVLWVTRGTNGLVFEQTEFTRKYMAQ